MAVPDTGRELIDDTTPTQLFSSSIGTVTRGVTVRADPAGSGTIYVGWRNTITKGVDALSGFPLNPGEAFFFEINEHVGGPKDETDIYAIATVDDNPLFWEAE